MKTKDHFISANNQIQNKHIVEICQNDFICMYCKLLSNIPVQWLKNKDRAETDNMSALTTHDTMLGQLCGECGRSFRKRNFPMFPCDQAVFSSPASPLTSLCSWWDQPLLGTLVVVTLQLPCERKVVKGKDGRGDKRKGWIKTPSKGQSDLSESSRPAD